MRHDDGTAAALGFAALLTATVALAKHGGSPNERSKKKRGKLSQQEIAALRQRGRKMKPLKKLVDSQRSVSVRVAAQRLGESPSDTLALAIQLATKPDYVVAQQRIFNVGALRRLIEESDQGMVYAGQAAERLEISLGDLEVQAKAIGAKPGYYYDVFDGNREGAEVGKVHPMRARMEWVLDNWQNTPEVGIRTVDLLLEKLPNSSIPDAPGTWQSNDDLVMAVQAFTGNDDADLSDYWQFYRDTLPKRELTGLLTVPGNKPMNLDRSAYQWGYLEYIPWIANGIRKMIKARKAAIWRGKQAGQAYEQQGMTQFLNELDQLRSQRLQYIFDWVEAERPDLTQMDFDDAYEASQEWHNRAREQVNAARRRRLKREGKWFDCPGGIHPVPGKILHRFDNDWTIREMSTYEELQNEGNLSKGGGCLGHCVGDSSNYYGMLERGTRRFLSLRDPKNRPLVTIEVDSSGQILQAKGLKNRVAGRYFGHGDHKGIIKHLKGYDDIEHYLDDEALMLMGAVKALRLRPTRDMAGVQGRVRDIEARKKAARTQLGSSNHWREVKLGLGGVPVPNRRRRRR
jgi:hypothetical protein